MSIKTTDADYLTLAKKIYDDRKLKPKSKFSK